MKIIERRRRSELLSKDEHKLLLKYIAKFQTLVDAADAIELPRQTLERVKIIGSGSPETIKKIREKLFETEAA
jgi:hypothetical protein